MADLMADVLRLVDRSTAWRNIRLPQPCRARHGAARICQSLWRPDGAFCSGGLSAAKYRRRFGLIQYRVWWNRP